MAEIPNVTGRIAELREFKKAKSLGRGSDSRPPVPPPKPPGSRRREKMAPPQARPLRERAVAPSYFTVGVYALLFFGLIAQLCLITLLDLL